MKNIKGIIFSIIIVIILVLVTFFSVNYAKTTSQGNKELEEKANSEIEYLDDKILSILNGLNNIELRNYAVSSYEVDEDEEEANKQETNSTKNSEDEGSNPGANLEDNKTKSNMYEMRAIGILNSSKEPNWEKIKTEIEIIYSSWNTIILDLYKLNVNSENILKFSSLLDRAAIAIKNEKKVESLNAVSDLYSLLPIYLESYQGNTKEVSIQKIKSSVMKAYSNVESEKWNEVNNEISNADNVYLNLLNGSSKEDNYDINKGYILLKELQNSIAQKDKDIFYIKYKNLIEKLNNF